MRRVNNINIILKISLQKITTTLSQGIPNYQICMHIEIFEMLNSLFSHMSCVDDATPFKKSILQKNFLIILFFLNYWKLSKTLFYDISVNYTQKRKKLCFCHFKENYESAKILFESVKYREYNRYLLVILNWWDFL